MWVGYTEKIAIRLNLKRILLPIGKAHMMNCTCLLDNCGRRSGLDRRSKLITLFADFKYEGPERRQNPDRRSGVDRRQNARMKVS